MTAHRQTADRRSTDRPTERRRSSRPLCYHHGLMRKLLCFLLLATPLLGEVKFADDKKAAAATIERHAAEMTTLSDEIWRHAETALKETQSAKALADYAEKQGFKVTRGVASMPTAFVAEFG